MLAVVLVVAFSAGVAAQHQPAEKDDAYQAQLQRGNEAIRQGQFEQALQAFKRAKGLRDKDSATACLGMAVAYFRLGAFKDAVESCDAALKRARDDRITESEIRNVRGTALVALAKRSNEKKLKEAEAEFRAALAADGNLHAARFNLGTTLLQLNRDEEGIRELKEYVQRAGTDRQVQAALRLIENPKRARLAYAPEFSFTSRQGEHIVLSELKGKAVLIDFWGSWCAPCVRATPGLARIAKKFSGSPVVILGIAHDKREDWDRFIDRNKMDWPQYLDEGRSIAALFDVHVYPTYVILDPDGVVRARRSGYEGGTDSWIESELKKALPR